MSSVDENVYFENQFTGSDFTQNIKLGSTLQWRVYDATNANYETAVSMNYTNGVIFKTPTQFQQGINAGSNKITGVATPTSNTDAATKAYVDSEIANLGGVGGGPGGTDKPTRLYNDNDVTVIRGTQEGCQFNDKNEVVRYSVDTLGSTLTGTATFKQAFSTNIIKYISTNDNNTYCEFIDFGDKLKWRQKFAKPLIFQVYSDDNSDVKSVLEMGYDNEYQATFYQPVLFESGAVLTRPNDTPWLIGGETDGRKSLYVKTDQYQGNRFTANYGKGFTFAIDTNIDNTDDDNATIFSLSSTYAMSHKKHRMFNGIDMAYKRVEFLGTPDQPNDAANKAYVDSARDAAVATSTASVDALFEDAEYTVTGATNKAYFSAVRTGSLWKCTLHIPKATHVSAYDFNFGTIIPAGFEPGDTVSHLVDSGAENIKAKVNTSGDVEVCYEDNAGAQIYKTDTGFAFSTSWIVTA